MKCEFTAEHSDLQPQDITLGPFRRDERLGFVYHVLDVVNESRTGRPQAHLDSSNAYTDDLPEWLMEPAD